MQYVCTEMRIATLIVSWAGQLLRLAYDLCGEYALFFRFPLSPIEIDHKNEIYFFSSIFHMQTNHNAAA